MSSAFKLKNGNILLSTEAPGGIYNASQLKKIASLCDRESIIVKATEDHRLALFVDPEKATQIADELKSIGLGIRLYQDGLHQPVSCIGELCEDHEQDALGTALDVTTELSALTLDSPLKIGINGCAKCCTPCHTLDISVVGDTNGYRISLGGKNSQLPEMASFMADGVPASETPRVIKSIVELFKQKAQDGETLQELIEREGAGAFITALAPWSQDAADTSDRFTTEAAATDTPDPDMALEPLEDDIPAELPLDLDLDLPASDDLSEASELPSIDEQDTISHANLSGVEVSDDELCLDDTPLDPDALTNDLAFNIVAKSPDVTADNLEDIAVDVPMDDLDLSMDQDISVADDPHISLQEIELADEVVDTLEESFVDDSLDGMDSLEEETAASGQDSLDAASTDELSEEDFSDVEIEISDTDLADDVSTLVSMPDSAPKNIASYDSRKNQDLSESIIDAGDVLNAPRITVAETKDKANVVAQELEQDTEDADFAMLSNSIDTIEKESEESITSQNNLNEGAKYLDSDESSTEGSEDDSSYELIDHENLEDLEAIEDDAHSDEHDDEHFDVTEHLPLSEIVTAKQFSKKSKKPSKAAWTIASFDVDDLGCPMITWTNGISVTVTQEAIAMGKIRIGGNELRISNTGSGVLVEIDGVRMLLPLAA